MKRIILLTLLICVTINDIVAQNNQLASAANRAFEQGNYKDAIEIYNGAIEAEKNATTAETFRARKNQAGVCLNYISQANSLFSQKKFTEAINLLNKLTSINGKDTYARNLKRKAQEQINAISLEKSLSKKLNDILILNNIDDLKKFAHNNPNYSKIETIKFILDYYNNSALLEKEPVQVRSYKYIEFGNIYYKQNKAVAAQFYEKAAACGSLVGFYNLAISLPQKEEDRVKRLLIMAAVNGQEDAAKLLISKYPNSKYNKETPKILYQYLVNANSGNLALTVVIQSNRSMIGLPNLRLIDEESEYINIKDNWEYELGMMFLEGEHVKINLNKAFYYLSDAASKGNYTAQYELAKMMKNKNETYYYALILCAAINGNSDAQALLSTDVKYAKAYAQYLINKKCDYFSMYMFLQYHAYKYKIEDIDAKLVAQACYLFLDRKSLREVNKLIKSKINWNEQTINEIQSTLANSSNKYHKKLLKQLSKIKVVNIESKPTYFQSLLTKGFCSTPYPAYKRTGIADFMPNTYSRTAAKSSTTANSTNRNTTYTKPEKQESNINYKISPRSNMSIGEAQGWCQRLGAGWRLASASEMRNIPGLYGTYWTNGGIRGALVDSHNNFRSRTSDTPNDRAGAVAIRK